MKLKPDEINPYEIISETTLKSNKSFGVKTYIIIILSFWLLFVIV